MNTASSNDSPFLVKNACQNINAKINETHKNKMKAHRAVTMLLSKIILIEITNVFQIMNESCGVFIEASDAAQRGCNS